MPLAITSLSSTAKSVTFSSAVLLGVEKVSMSNKTAHMFEPKPCLLSLQWSYSTTDTVNYLSGDHGHMCSGWTEPGGRAKGGRGSIRKMSHLFSLGFLLVYSQ